MEGFEERPEERAGERVAEASNDAQSTRPRPWPSLAYSVGLEACIGYISVPFYGALHLLVPKGRGKRHRDNAHAEALNQGAKSGTNWAVRLGSALLAVVSTWIRSVAVAVAVAVVSGAALGAVDWLVAKCLNRCVLDGAPAVITGLGVPAQTSARATRDSQTVEPSGWSGR